MVGLMLSAWRGPRIHPLEEGHVCAPVCLNPLFAAGYDPLAGRLADAGQSCFIISAQPVNETRGWFDLPWPCICRRA